MLTNTSGGGGENGLGGENGKQPEVEKCVKKYKRSIKYKGYQQLQHKNLGKSSR